MDPTTQQASPALPPPPEITLDDIIGGAPAAAAAAASAADAAAAGTAGATGKPAAGADKNLAEVASALGVTVSEGADVKATLMPMLEMIAKNGQAQEQAQIAASQQPGTPQVVRGLDLQSQQGTPAPAATGTEKVEFKWDDLDLGEASPEIKKAFNSLGKRSSEAIATLQKEAQQAQLAAAHTSAQFAEATRQAQISDQQHTSQQAINYLDGLASPKYGVGNNRTLAQTLASEQVMRTAGSLIRGMSLYGQSLPIEQVVNAAILATGDDIPAAPTAPAPAAGLPPTTPQGTAAPAPAVHHSGSAGAGGTMMADAEYMAGARAILAR